MSGEELNNQASKLQACPHMNILGGTRGTRNQVTDVQEAFPDPDWCLSLSAQSRDAEACFALPVCYQTCFSLPGDDADVMFCSIEAVCWGFNGIPAFTWPLLSVAFTPSGAVRARPSDYAPAALAGTFTSSLSSGSIMCVPSRWSGKGSSILTAPL